MKEVVNSIFYYTGLIGWLILSTGAIIYFWGKLPPVVKNYPADLCFLIRTLFMSKKKAQWYYNGLNKSSNIIKNRWAYKPCMWILEKKLTKRR